MGFLDREDLIQSEPAGAGTPDDLTRSPLELPASRALRLQALTRGDEGFILGMAYSTQRGYARNHAFVAELRIGGHAGDQGGLHEVATPLMTLTAGNHFGALAQGIFQMLHDFIGGAPVDKGSLGNAFFKAIAYFHGFDGNLEFLHKGIVDAFLYQETVHAHAGLAGVAELAGHGAFHGFIQVGIVEHQKGGVAAQFQ